MRGTIFKLLPILLVAGCATTPGIRTIMVDKPVIKVEKCIRTEDIPVRPTPLHSEAVPSDLETALSKTLAKISEWTQYGNKADPLFKKCAE